MHRGLAQHRCQKTILRTHQGFLRHRLIRWVRISRVSSPPNAGFRLPILAGQPDPMPFFREPCSYRRFVWRGRRRPRSKRGRDTTQARLPTRRWHYGIEAVSNIYAAFTTLINERGILSRYASHGAVCNLSRSAVRYGGPSNRVSINGYKVSYVVRRRNAAGRVACSRGIDLYPPARPRSSAVDLRRGRPV